MPSIKKLPIWMLDAVATCVTTLVIHVIPHLVVNLSKYLMASTYKQKNMNHQHLIIMKTGR
jgi:hypothetical protein